MHWFPEPLKGWVLFIWPDGYCVAEKFDGQIIRMGPNAIRRPDPYVWAIPLSEAGEFVGVSTAPLTRTAVRTAQEAGRSLLGKEPFWRHRKQEKSMEDVFTYRIEGITILKNGEPFYKAGVHQWDNMGYVGMQSLNNALHQAPLALGNARAAEMAKPA